MIVDAASVPPVKALQRRFPVDSETSRARLLTLNVMFASPLPLFARNC